MPSASEPLNLKPLSPRTQSWDLRVLGCSGFRRRVGVSGSVSPDPRVT